MKTKNNSDVKTGDSSNILLNSSTSNASASEQHKKVIQFPSTNSDNVTDAQGIAPKNQSPEAMLNRLGRLVAFGAKRDLPPAAAIAKYLADEYQNTLAFDKTSQQWMKYETEYPGVWSLLDDVDARGLAQKELDQIPDASLNYGSHYVESVLTLLESRLTANSWDSQENLLPMRNGVLDLKSKELLPHSPDNRFTWSLPYDYDPVATCDPILEWLDETTNGDPQVQQLLLAYMQAVLVGRVDIQRFVELVGPGGTGKSTYANLVIALVGNKNIVTSNFKALSNRFENANLYGKKLLYLTDSARYSGDASNLKALTGRDQIRYEQKYKPVGPSFVFKGQVLIAANEPIQFDDSTSGLQRRRISVPFLNKVDTSQMRHLIEVTADKVEGEFADYLPGLLNHVLNIPEKEVTRLLKETSSSVLSLATTQRTSIVENNPMAAWADERLVADSGAKTKIGDKSKPSNEYLYPNYVEYCQDNGHRAESNTRFSRLLLDLANHQLKLDGVEKKHTRTGNQIIGLRFRQPADNKPTLVTMTEYEHLPNPLETAKVDLSTVAFNNKL